MGKCIICGGDTDEMSGLGLEDLANVIAGVTTEGEAYEELARILGENACLKLQIKSMKTWMKED